MIGCTEPVIPKDLHAMIVHLPHLEKPQDFHMDANEFCSVAMKLWLEQDFGYDHGMARPNADHGWIGYMAKNRSKDGLEHYFDCIDLDTYFNKAVSG